MSVLLIMEIVSMNVIILLVRTIAPAILDIDYTLIGKIVQVRMSNNSLCFVCMSAIT